MLNSKSESKCVIVELNGARITLLDETFRSNSSPQVSSLCSVKHSDDTSDWSVRCVFQLEATIVLMICSYGPFQLYQVLLLKRNSFQIPSISYSLKNFWFSSIPCIHGCWRISGIVSHSLGSLFNTPRSKSLASWEMSSFRLYFAFMMSLWSSGMEFALKGTFP